jgi:group I intron endonuclease
VLETNSKIQYKTAMIARVPLSYASGKIYKLVNDVNDNLYIGSTTQALSKRMVQHRSDAKRMRQCKVHIAMNAIGVHHFSIILIEAFPCASKDALEAREFEITNVFDRTRLYNDKFNNVMSEERIARRSATQKIMRTALRGAQHYFFTRGSIHPKRMGSFEYSWQIDGVQHRKSYCFAKEGSRELAYLKCIDLRNATFPLTTEDYSKELPFFED